MRLRSSTLIACCVLGSLVALACNDARAISTIPNASPAISSTSDIQALAGLWRLTVDPSTLATRLMPEPIRTVSDNDDLYLLSTNRFFTGGVIQITDVRTTTSTLDIDYQVTHPIPAPSDPTAPASASNRADLGIAGRVAFLVEVPTATGNTFFSDRVANTALIVNPDHYYAPAGLLAELHLPANTFPCQTLVDELAGGSRIDIDNGGTPTGNFGADGWTRAEFGVSANSWTGYGVLHQGQTSARSVSINLAALSAVGTLDINVALLVRYNDPRGGADSDEKRANRLPPASPDHTKFAYRMPHGALDGAPITFTSESGTFEADLASSSTLGFTVVDWDARSTETTKANLFDDGDVTKVAVGESGAPTLAVCIPGVLGTGATVDLWAADTLLDDDTSIGGDIAVDSGRPGDALYYEKLVTKSAGTGQTGGTYTGMVRITDPEAALVAPLAVALDAATLAPLTVDLPSEVTYQAFTVEQQPGPTGVPGWVTTITNEEFASAQGIAVNAAGQASIYGQESVPEEDMPFIHASSYSPDGTQLWRREYHSTDFYQATGVEIDDAGNTYLTGHFRFPIDLGQGSIDPKVGSDAFVVKLDPGGDTTWVRTFGGSSGSAAAYAIALDSIGRVLVTGNFFGTLNFGGSDRVSNFSWNTFVLQLSSGGIYQWDRTYSMGTKSNYGFGIVAGQNDQPVVIGQFEEVLDFGGGERTSTGDFDAYALCLTQAGAYVWDYSWGSQEYDSPTEIEVDIPTGRIFLAARARDAILGQTYSGGLDAVLVALSGSGSLDWVQQIGGSGDDEINGLAITPAGRLYATGSFEGTCLGCNSGTPAVGEFDAFLIRMNLAGTPIWYRTFGALATESASGIDVDSSGDLRVSGIFDGTCDFDPGPGLLSRTALGSAYDGYILRLSGSTGYL